ncbi:MAG TPA: DUF6371 domain-containing protein [Ferruginibacter sp.]|nr:DUF6371 domain-containing protein [Ferruginibacter sp.]
MTLNTSYKFVLEKSSRKIVCPGCGKKTAVRYMNTETKEFLPDHVCRCDRENNCGYHLTAGQYFKSEGIEYKPTTKQLAPVEEIKVDLMLKDYIEKSMCGYDKTNFATWLISLLTEKIANQALLKYFVGRSRNDGNRATIFWRIDKDGNVRTGKVISYNPLTGKRNKDRGAYMVHPKEKFNCVLCFFGEHLLTEYPNKTVGIVESEKTAIVASIFIPDMVWIATGGNSGCKWREWSVFNVLKDRRVILFPDFGFFNKKTAKTCFAEWSERATMIRRRMSCNISISRILEDRLSEEERINDFDLADMLIKTESPGGLAMTDIPGYPVMWDMHAKT